MEVNEVVHLHHIHWYYDYHHHHHHHHFHPHHHHHHHHTVKRRQSGVGSGWRGNLGFSLEATPHPPPHDENSLGRQVLYLQVFGERVGCPRFAIL